MFFTQEDYRKIEKWLLANSVKDTEFAGASLPLKGNETVAFVQDGKNVNVLLKDLIEQIFLLGVSDFLNVTDKYGESRISLTQAIQLIPYKSRKIGQVITFLDEDGEWKLFQFQGERVNQWNNATLWVNLIERIQGISIIDSEDITATVDNLNQTSLTFADKNYNTADYSGLGRVYLRKNIQSVVNPNTGITYSTNLLTQAMLSKENTIYIIQYDYNLNGQTITIPSGCVLQFEGGSISNGNINFVNTNITNLNNSTIFKNVSLSGSISSELSPYMFGFRPNQADSYSEIYLTHLAAKELGTSISYNGIKEVNIRVSAGFESIPLTGQDDFCGAVFHITNTQSTGSYILFTLTGEEDIVPNSITLDNVRNGNYSLDNNKQYTLFVKDTKLWTARRGATSAEDRYREDVICIRNNKAINYPCTTYGTDVSIECTLMEDKPYQRYLRNLTAIREDGIGMIKFISIEYCSNMEISNVTLNTFKGNNTPKNGDNAFIMKHCALFNITNMNINNVYSVSGSGHGYELDTVYHIVYDNITGYDNNWGIFGANNVNDVAVYNSNINRFDVHCYGRDIKFYNCTFTGNKYNQFSGMYGIISFEDCIFGSQFLPYLQEGTYNAYTFHELIFRNCQLYTNKGLYLFGFEKATNPRSELADKYLPSIRMENITYYSSNTFNLILVDSPLTPDGNFQGMMGLYDVTVDGLRIANTRHNFNIANTPIAILNSVNMNFSNCNTTNMGSYKEVEVGTYPSKIDTSRIQPTIPNGTITFNKCFIGLYPDVTETFNHVYKGCILYNYRYSNNPNSIYKKFEDCIIVLSNSDDGNNINMIKDSYYYNCKFVSISSRYLNFFMYGKYVFKGCTKENNAGRTGALLSTTQIWATGEGAETKQLIIDHELDDLLVIYDADRGIVHYNSYPYPVTDNYYPFTYISANNGEEVLPFIHGKNKINYNVDGTQMSKVVII